MPTATYDLIASTTLAASSPEVVFGSIPGTYRDLVLIVDGTSSVGINGSVYFNSDTTSSNYPYVRMYGTGSSVTSNTGNNIWFDMQTNRTMLRIQVMDYSASNKHKTSLSRWDTAQNLVGATTIRWANTAPITSLQVKDTNNAATFSAGSTFALYGIAS